MLLPQFQPLPLSRARAPFSHRDWIFEVKWDGFRALLRSDEQGVRLVSRNGNAFKSFPGLCEGLARDLRGRRCVLDGEIVCLDSEGKPQFRDLLFRRADPVFYAFDILWDEHASSDDEEETRRFSNGEDTRYLPLIDRKLRLRRVVPKRGDRLLYCDHIDGDGEGLFRLACEHDLEGIVAKRKGDPYLPEHAEWLKIRNQTYSQWVGREELFERERGSDPDVRLWEGCVAACVAAGIRDSPKPRREACSAIRRVSFLPKENTCGNAIAHPAECAQCRYSIETACSNECCPEAASYRILNPEVVQHVRMKPDLYACRGEQGCGFSCERRRVAFRGAYVYPLQGCDEGSFRKTSASLGVAVCE